MTPLLFGCSLIKLISRSHPAVIRRILLTIVDLQNIKSVGTMSARLHRSQVACALHQDPELAEGEESAEGCWEGVPQAAPCEYTPTPELLVMDGAGSLGRRGSAPLLSAYICYVLTEGSRRSGPSCLQ